jgi:hypothetical protein
VGRATSRRRKPRRPLPKLPDLPDDNTPPVMWSPPGSGFEASPYSPAGRIQGMWQLNRYARFHKNDPRRPMPRGLAIGLIVISAVLLVPVLVALVAAL